MPKKKKEEVEEVVAPEVEAPAEEEQKDAPADEPVTVRIQGQRVTGFIRGNKLVTPEGITYAYEG